VQWCAALLAIGFGAFDCIVSDGAANLVESFGSGNDRSRVLSFTQSLHLVYTILHFPEMTLIRLLAVAAPIIAALGLRLANQ